MSGHTVSPGGLADALRRLSEAVPEAVERAMVDGGMMLQGRLIQKEIAASTPHQPVDQGQYKASFQLTETEGGCVVGSTAKHSVWIERGRKPGPVPLAPIVEWVKRKGLAKRAIKAARMAARAARKGVSPPKPALPAVSPHAPAMPDQPKHKGVGDAMKKAERAAAAAKAIDDEAERIAINIARKIKLFGIKPHWVVRRAITALGPKMPSIIKRAIREVQA